MKDKPRDEKPDVDPRGGDEILKRMLKAKPKTHDEMVKERRTPKAARKAKPE